MKKPCARCTLPFDDRSKEGQSECGSCREITFKEETGHWPEPAPRKRFRGRDAMENQYETRNA